MVTPSPEHKTLKFNIFEIPKLDPDLKLCVESEIWNQVKNVKNYPKLKYGRLSNISIKLPGTIWPNVEHDWITYNEYCKKLEWYPQYLKERVMGKPGSKDIRAYVMEILDEEL